MEKLLLRTTLFFAGIMATLFCVAVFIGCYYTRPNTETLEITADVMRSGLLPAAEKMMLSYDGRYFTNLLHGLNPVARGYFDAYNFLPLAAIALFTFAVYFWLRTFFDVSRKKGVPAALLFVFVHFGLSPDISSELFNMIAVYVYLYGSSLWLIWTAAAFRYYTAGNG